MKANGLLDHPLTKAAQEALDAQAELQREFDLLCEQARSIFDLVDELHNELHRAEAQLQTMIEEATT